MTYIHYCLHIAGPAPALLKWAAEVYSWAVKQPTPCTKLRKFLTKGVTNHSHGVFVNQYWNLKCSCECRSVLEVLLVCCACRRRPMAVDLVSMSTATLHLGMCLEYHAFSLRLHGNVSRNNTFFF